MSAARAHARYVAMCVGVIAFTLAFLAPLFAPLAVPWYRPVEREWTFEIKPAGLAIDFYGRLAFAVLAWAFAVGASLIGRRATLGGRARGLVLAWAIAAITFAMFYFAWTLYYRVPDPVPIPAGYVPR